jgi:hypothetical protein
MEPLCNVRYIKKADRFFQPIKETIKLCQRKPFGPVAKDHNAGRWHRRFEQAGRVLKPKALLRPVTGEITFVCTGLHRPTIPEMRPRGPKPGSLGTIIGSFKSAVSYRINKEYNITGIWQRNYYERIIPYRHDVRNEREMPHPGLPQIRQEKFVCQPIV